MIYSTILGKDKTTIIENLQTALADLVENHRDTSITLAGFWDTFNSCFILFTNFIEYVVTPHIANLLIQEDLKTTEDNANTYRLQSKDIGDAFQHTDGNDLDADVVMYSRLLQTPMRPHCLSDTENLVKWQRQ